MTTPASSNSAAASTSNSSPCSGSGCDQPFGSSSTLYVRTVLVTLIVLGFITAFVVIRSIFLRRRRQIAIANGTFVPDDDLSRFYKSEPVREKPQMYDVYVQWEHGDSKDGRWDVLSPVSATDAASLAQYQTTKARYTQSARSVRPRLTRGRRLWNGVKRHLINFIPIYSWLEPTPAPSRVDSPPPPTPISAPIRTSEDRRMLQLAILVRMPDPLHDTESLSDHSSHRTSGSFGEEEKVPYFEVGLLNADLGETRTGSESFPAKEDV